MVNILKLDFSINRQSFLRLTRLFSQEEGTCLLYSGNNKENNVLKAYNALSRPQINPCSYLALFPLEQIWVYGNRQWKQQLGQQEKQLNLSPWEGLKQLLPSFNQEQRISQNPHPSYFGFFGYEMGHYADPQKQHNYHEDQFDTTSTSTPDSYFQRTALVIAVDHSTESIELIIAKDWEQKLRDTEQQFMKQLLNPLWWSQFLSEEKNMEEIIRKTFPQNGCIIEQQESQASYINKVKSIQELINDGDVYQVNLSQQFILRSFEDPLASFDLFESLTKINPAPYSAYFKLPNFSIACSSPELFLQKRGSHLLTRPIKGTIARGVSPEQDASNRQKLLSSEKDRAELLMIVDLMRNDLGKISLPASVKTEEIWGCEAYNNVFHLVATINSRALSGLHPLDLLRNCFPGGSITGCPKLKAMEVIQAMENRRRGIYTGSIGYFCDNGDFEFNIAIRTAVVQDGHIDLQLGGAIMTDSDPEQEYAETLQKGHSIFKALGVESK